MIEFRGRQFLWSSLSLGILLVFLMGMGLDAAAHPPDDWSAGLLWLCLFFAASITFNRHDAKDREFGAWSGLLLAPVDRSMLFYAKWTSTGIFLFVVDCVVSGAYYIILNAPGPRLVGLFLLVVLLGTLSLTGVGTFVSSLASHSSMRDVLTPVLLFPLCVPLFLAIVRMTVYTMTAPNGMPWIWMEVLVGYMVAFSVLPWLLFEPLMEV